MTDIQSEQELRGRIRSSSHRAIANRTKTPARIKSNAKKRNVEKKETKLPLSKTKSPISDKLKELTINQTKPEIREVYLCFKCDRKHKTKRGLTNHMKKCLGD